jgi:hypothetical protein
MRQDECQMVFGPKLRKYAHRTGGIRGLSNAQRIDITGHAVSALMKSVENGIECGSGCG